MNRLDRSPLRPVLPSALAALLAAGVCVAPSTDARAACAAAPPSRCLRAGDRDPSFGFDGVAVHDLGNGSSRGAMDMVLLADGRVVMGGSSSLDGGENHDPTLVRVGPNGFLDGSFGTGGVVRIPLGEGNAIIQSVAVQPDGKILAAGGRDEDPFRQPGYTTGYLPRETFLFRFEANGDLDESFGVGGQVVVNTFPILRRYDRVLLQPDGKILVVGLGWSGTGEADYFVERYDSTGALDSSYGSAGVASTKEGLHWATYERAGATLAPDGSVLIGASVFAVGPYINCALVRVDANGALDPSFGTAGHVVFPQEAGDVCNLKAVTLQPDGKILAGGTFYEESDEQAFALWRLNDDGSPDLSFRKLGRSLTRITRYPVTTTTWAVLVEADGKIVEAGSNGGAEFDLARHKSDGRLDRKFGRRGVARIGRPFAPRTAVFDGAHAVARLPSGHLLVGGNPGHEGTFALTRVLDRPCIYDPNANQLSCP